MEGAEGVPVSAHVHEPLTDCRHDLLVLAEVAAVGTDEELGVEERPDRLRPLFADAHHGVHPRVPGCSAQGVDLRARDIDGVLEQLDAEMRRHPAGCGMKVEPDRVGRDEPFRERDQLGTLRAGLANQTTGLLGRRLSVQEDRRGLYGRCADGGIDVGHLRPGYPKTSANR
jgi:hypothetical protein